MRIASLALAAALAACGQTSRPATPPAEGQPAPALITRENIVGVWSFDRSCASGDGMNIDANGNAGFTEEGVGTWTIDAQGRLVLDLRIVEMGSEIDPAAAPQTTVTIEAAQAAGDDLLGAMSGTAYEGVPAYANEAINARRCRPEELE